MFQSLNMKLTPLNLSKLVLMVAIIANLLIKYSKNIKIDNVFVITSILIILLTLFYDIQISALLFLLFITFFYHSKNISFNLIPVVHYYNENEAIEGFEGGDVGEQNDDDDELDNTMNQEPNQQNNNMNNENPDDGMMMPSNNENPDNGMMMPSNNENSDNEMMMPPNNENSDDEMMMPPNNNNDELMDMVKNANVNNSNINNNENIDIENFEQPVNIPNELKELNSLNEVKANIQFTQKTEQQDLNDYIAHAVYVPFEQLNSIQNNQIQSFDNDQEFVAAIEENYYEKISY